MITQSVYAFRGFVYSEKNAESSWSARLCRGARRIARVIAGATGEITVEFDCTRDRRTFESFLSTVYPRESLEEAGTQFLSALADETYHRRRLQVVSLRHTVFRLADDPPDAYRYLQGLPLSAELVGKLRLTYGQRLLEVLRAESLAPAHAA